MAALAGVALLAGGGAAVWHVRTAPPKLPEQTRDATMLAAAQQVLAGLTPPPGAVADATATACGVPSPYCATSRSASPQELAAGLYADLRRQGLTGRELNCPMPYGDMLGINCAGYLTYQNALVELRSGGAAADPFSPRSWVAARLVQAEPGPLPADAPLPDWAALAVQPAAWSGSSSCSHQTADGCRQYDGRLTVSGDPVAATDGLVETLVTRGYRIGMLRCKTPTGSSPAHCLVAAGRFRRAGGGDAVRVTAVLSGRVPGHVSVLLSVSAH